MFLVVYHDLASRPARSYKNAVSQIEEEGIKNKLIDDDIKSKLVNDLFYIDIQFDRSIFYLDNLKDRSSDIYHRNKYSVECINDKHIFYHFDSYGRMHTNFTILKAFIRKNCLLIDGEETVEIDIPNSQPLFLVKLMEDSNWIDRSELLLFKELTTKGIYYDWVSDKWGVGNKKQIKELNYKVLFGRNQTNSKADKLFKSTFPTIHNFIKLYKKENNNNYKVLAYALQKAESNLIFNKIIKKVKLKYPHIKIVSIHDSIIIPKKYHNEVNEIFKNDVTHLKGKFRIPNDGEVKILKVDTIRKTLKLDFINA